MPEIQFLWNLILDETKLNTFSEDDFMETLNKHLAPDHDYGEKAGELRKLLAEFYLRADPYQVKNNTFYLERLVDVSFLFYLYASRDE